MSPKIHQSFWSDPELENQAPEIKLTMLWVITNSSTNLIGICKGSSRRFSFETGLSEDVFTRALKALSKPLVVVGENIFIRNFIRHQFGTGDKLTKNNVFSSMASQFLSLNDPDLQAEVLSEYPEFEGLHKPSKTPCQGVREGEEKEKDKEKIQLMLKINSWFGRRPDTQWDTKELAALRKVIALKTPPEDFQKLDEHYSARPKRLYLRQDIQTLLNNWNGEIDRAKNWTAPNAAFAPKAGESVYEIKTRIEAKTKRLTELRQRGHEDAFGIKLRPEDVEEAKRLKTEIKELEKKLAN